MKLEDMTDKELVEAFENACFMVAHHDSPTRNKRLDEVEEEILRRLVGKE